MKILELIAGSWQLALILIALIVALLIIYFINFVKKQNKAYKDLQHYNTKLETKIENLNRQLPSSR